MLREPHSRNWSAFHFEKKQGLISEALSYDDYLAINHNFQTRILTEGLGGTDLKPNEISDFFTMGIVERFDASMIAFEWILAEKGIQVDFAFPQKLNTQNYAQITSNQNWAIKAERLAAEMKHANNYQLDFSLYQNSNKKLNRILAKIPNLKERAGHYFRRMEEKRTSPERLMLTQDQSPTSFTYIAPTTRDGMLPGHENTQPKCDFGVIRH